jgi:lysophospholipase L1-like esterase
LKKAQRRLLIKLISLLMSGIFALLIAEGFMRVVGLTYPSFWEPDPELGWRHLKEASRHFTDEGNAFVTTNSLGQRDEERQFDKDPGTYRIAVFGDSLTEAVQVDLQDTFCQLLEERMSTKGRPVEVLNFGVSGYSPVQELLSFKRNGPIYDPDLVILALFLDNDVANCHPELTPEASARPFMTFENDAIQIDFSRTQESYSDYHRQPIHLVRRVSCVYRLVSELRRKYAEARDASSREGSKSIPKRFLFYEENLRPEWEEAWSVFDKVLLEFVKESRRQNVPLILVSVPAGHVVSSRGWEATLKDRPAMADRQWTLAAPEERLAAFAQANTIPLIRPYEAFKNAAGTTPLHFGHNGHLTAAGHQLMANAIYDHLVANDFVSRAER